MLFQGQEFGVDAPFLYFADHEPELARAGPRRAGASSCAQFPSIARAGDARSWLADPGSDPRRFERCKLDWAEARAPRRRRRATPRPLAACGARTRRSRAGQGAAARRRGAGPGGVRCCASSARAATTGCCSSISAATSTARDRRAARGAAGRTHLALPLVERAPGYGGGGRPNREADALAHPRPRRRRARRRSRRAGLSRRSGRDGTLTGSGQRGAGPCRSPDRGISMIPKSGNRFSEKIMPE